MPSTRQQLDKATPDLQAPFEAPDMPLTEEQAAKQAARKGLARLSKEFELIFKTTMSRWQKTENGWQKTEAPVPEQKTTEPPVVLTP